MWPITSTIGIQNRRRPWRRTCEGRKGVLKFHGGVVMADKAKSPPPKPKETVDPKAPQPEKDDQRLRDTSRPAHPHERDEKRD